MTQLKKLFFLFLLISLVGNAQLADGSAAPDFTAVDLNGNTHSLSDYLSEGKTVVLDFSATWCSSCWRAHKAPAFSDLYYSYGPEGSDELVVFFIESDPNTTIEDLYGTGSSTIGNWVEDTPYPIIDSSEIGNLYQIVGYPTFLKICPDGNGGGTVFEMVFENTEELISDIESGCEITLSGTSNHVKVNDTKMASCSSLISPEIRIHNYGTNDITSAEVILLKDDVQIASQNYSGNISPRSGDFVTFPEIDFDTNAVYTAKVTKVNNANPFDTELAIGTVSLDNSEKTSGSLDVTIKISTDLLPQETEWRLLDSSDAVVASGGSYQPYTLTTESVDVTLIEGECYTMVVTDTHGNGMNSGFGFGSFEIKNALGETFISGGVFDYIVRESFTATSTLSVSDEITSTDLLVYPNPAKDFINVSFNGLDSDYNLTLVDASGRVIPVSLTPTKNGSRTELKVDISNLNKGVYFIKHSSSKGVTLKKVIIL